ncbi:ricin-type beta-trefoil lectin domain protein [Bradyrhizobium manausense]|uniref:ricin-type beta-trefoil lectin domain protein n=1 Tax=Bradyrhizobium manausense TaxID=989370 RepID=UPI001BAB42C9|nr:ricin-type beta-trefoil lectin domain protein [Bradyrhizobium manausense]MBR0686231.1 ricin-type beta-trefoil lectin domain protein [Bradyrhizobium manausense]
MFVRFAIGVVAFILLTSMPGFAATMPVDCKLIVDGKTYIDGVCEFARTDADGSFSIYGDKYWASIGNIENDKGLAYWNESPGATHAQSRLGDVNRSGGCWENRRVRICALAIEPVRRDKLLAQRPKGLRITPSYADYLCLSAPNYQFVAGAPLSIDRCDAFWGVRQRVFRLSGDKISLEGKPELCIDARVPTGTEDAALVLADCAHVAIRWAYDATTNLIRSDNNLCWSIRFSGDRKIDNWSPPIGARPCDVAPAETSQFAIGGD